MKLKKNKILSFLLLGFLKLRYTSQLFLIQYLIHYFLKTKLNFIAFTFIIIVIGVDFSC
jgi:hypothetical protein